MVLCVAGDLEPDDILGICDKMLKPCEKHTIESYFEDEPYEVEEHYVEQRFPVSMPIFNLGFKEKAHKTTQKEMAEVEIILNILTSRASELYRKLDDAKLINQSFDSEYFYGQGYNYVLFSSESRAPKEAAQMILDYIRELKENGVRGEDFEIAKREVYGDTISSLNSVDGIANTLAELHFNNAELFSMIEDIADCTLEDVNNRLRNMLDVENTTLSVVLPSEE